MHAGSPSQCTMGNFSRGEEMGPLSTSRGVTSCHPPEAMLLSKRARNRDLLPMLATLGNIPPSAFCCIAAFDAAACFPSTSYSKRACIMLRLEVRVRACDLAGDAGRISELTLEERDPPLGMPMGAVDRRLRGMVMGRGSPAAPGGVVSPLPALLMLELLLMDRLLCCSTHPPLPHVKALCVFWTSWSSRSHSAPCACIELGRGAQRT